MSPAASLRVLHVVPSFYPAVRYGGPIQSVLATCRALVEQGVDLEVVTTDADGPGSLAVPTDRVVDVEGVPVRYFARWPRTGFTVSAPLARYLWRTARKFDVVHVTAAFSFPSTVACAAARRAGVPYVVSPRGSCRPFALAQKRWKKAPYWLLLERNNLRDAAALHATSEVEAQELRALFPGQRVWCIPNGVDLPAHGDGPPRLPGRALFLGRIHPVKALDRLLQAMSIVAKSMPNAELVVAGPDDVGEWSRLERLLAQLEPRPMVRYVGRVEGREKEELLASATLLALPSHTENFGQVVLEALAHGTPVVASRHTPWRKLEERGAGAWVANDPAELASAILSILGDPALASRMEEQARALAAEYSWARVAASLVEGYKAVARRSASPE